MKIVMIQGKYCVVKKWAKWFAIDEDGEGYIYSEPPEIDMGLRAWAANLSNPFRFYKMIGRFELSGIDWRETLIELTEL